MTADLEQPVRQPASDEGSPYDYDLLVIGAGSAGFAAAIRGAELGYRVAIVEAATIGGTCVNVGCVPSKALIRAVEQYHLAGQLRFRGVYTAPQQLRWPEVIAHKDELVATMRQDRYMDVLASYPEITLVRGHATLVERNGVDVDGRAYRPRKIVIATGAHPWAPPVPGLAEAGHPSDSLRTGPSTGCRRRHAARTGQVLTSTTAMELTELPRSMIVLGANAVGLELAQTFARAGTFVIVLELQPRIAPFEDVDISLALKEYLEDEGLQIVTNFQTINVDRRDRRYYLTGVQDGTELTFDADELLVATGRRANTTGMGLAKAGVRLGQRGQILVNDTLQTSNPAIYAAGDVLGEDMFVYVAAYQGSTAAENALTDNSIIADTSAIPRITFTDPQIASAGLTEAQARAQGYDVAVSTLPMEQVPRALAARDTRGLIKLVADEASDRLLGAHVLAPEGGEVVQTAVLAIRFGITLTQLRQTLFPYLTSVEGLKLAALGFEKDIAKLSCCAG